MAPVIIGLGTGRCGTHSLVEVLNAQEGVRAFHEPKPILNWNPAAEAVDIVERFRAHLAAYEGQIVAEVSLFLLLYAPLLLKKFPQARVLVLERSRELVIESYLRRSSRHGVDHWREGPGIEHNTWSCAYPRFEASSTAAAIGSYWDWYRGQALALEHEHPERVRIVETDAFLNDPSTQIQALAWLGVPEPRYHHAHASPTRTAKASGARLESCTFCVKTIERPEALWNCLKSIRQYARASPIVVVDDSRQPYAQGLACEMPGPMIKVIEAPYDIGVSAGRNLANAAVDTEFLCQLDDDWVLDAEGHVGEMMDALASHDLDIVTGRLREPSGRICGWEATFERAGTVLATTPVDIRDRLTPIHLGSDFLVARAQTMREFTYFEPLKTAREHIDFFYAAHLRGARVACHPRATVLHCRPPRTTTYSQLRFGRYGEYDEVFLRRHHLTHAVLPSGKVIQRKNSPKGTYRSTADVGAPN